MYIWVVISLMAASVNFRPKSIHSINFNTITCKKVEKKIRDDFLFSKFSQQIVSAITKCVVLIYINGSWHHKQKFEKV